jgi:photosystem II stability/assembly factor-like uncharacterized protein
LRLIVATIILMTACAARAGDTAPYRWGNVAILGGGFVSGIITHPTEKGLIYCRTDIGGAYRWDESNRRWIPITDWISGPDWNYSGIESLAVDPSDPNRVYIATGTYTNKWVHSNGAIFRSHDRGATWQKAELPFKNGGNEEGRNAGERLMVDPNDGNVIFFGSRNNGLWKSADGGMRWQQVESFPGKGKTNGIGLVFVAFDPNAKGTIYVGNSDKQHGIYRSADGGNSWEALSGEPQGMLPNHGVVFPDGSLWVTYANAPGPNGMTDGAVWKFDPKSPEWTNVSPIKPGGDDKFGYCGVTFDAQKPGTLIVSSMDRWAKKDTLFRSTDGGRTWDSLLARDKATFDHATAPYTARMTPHWTGDVEIDPADSNHVLFVTGYGIWATRDLAHWTFDNEGLEECVINDVASPPATAPDSALVLCAMWDLDGFRHVALDKSPPDGNYQPSYGRTTSMDFAQLDPNLIVRVYGGGEKTTHGSYSTDNGKTWKPFDKAADPKGDGKIAVSADGSTFVWATESGGAFWSRDRGATWTACKGFPEKARLCSDRGDPNVFYGFDNTTGTVVVSSDGGTSFAPAASDLPKSEEPRDLAAVPGKGRNMFLCTDSGLFRSTDAGQHFDKVAAVQKASRIAFGKAAAGKDHPTIFIVGLIDGAYGFYRSDDAGASWLRINDDQHQFANISSIAGDLRTFGRVYLGSSSRGVIYGEPLAK